MSSPASERQLDTDAPPRARPAGLAEARDAILEGAVDGAALRFDGGGTKADWGAPVTRTDLVVETGGLDALVAHDAGDLTATVGAGMPVARLQEELRAAGQWLAVDPPGVEEGATVGGVFAAADSGPRRLRYGAVRDLVIGLTVVLSDGTVARSGGRVIKNVAGYDLGKLFCGSLGTLGLVTELTVRLHPLPAASATVLAPADVAIATAVTLDLGASPVEPSSVEWDGSDLLVRVEGSPEGVAAQARAVEERMRAHGGEPQHLEGPGEAAAWDAAVRGLGGGEGQTVVAVATLPTRVPQVAEALRAAAGEAGVDARLRCGTALGLCRAVLSGAGPAEHAAAVEGWRRRLVPLGAAAVVRRRVPGFDAHAGAWLAAGAPPPPTLPLLRAVRQSLDPAGRCAPGRAYPGAM